MLSKIRILMWAWLVSCVVFGSSWLGPATEEWAYGAVADRPNEYELPVGEGPIRVVSAGLGLFGVVALWFAGMAPLLLAYNLLQRGQPREQWDGRPAELEALQPGPPRSPSRRAA